MADYNVNAMTVFQLKKFLSQRGVSSTGKRKEELILLAEKAGKTYSVLEECDREESERKRRKINKENGQVLDLYGATVVWQEKLNTMPVITDADAFAYFVSHCGWSLSRLSAYKSSDGYLMFNDGHVEKVEMGIIADHEDYVYIMGKVKPEQRYSGERYNTWILVDKNTSVVKSAGCQCVASDDGSCKHVVGLLFSLAEYNTRRADKGTVVCTDTPQLWSQARKQSLPVPVTELDYRKNKSAPKKLVPIPKNYAPLQHVTLEYIQQVQNKLKIGYLQHCPGALFLKSLTPCPPKELPPNMRDHLTKFQSSNCDNFVDYLKESVTEKEIEMLKDLDQGSNDWKHARYGRLTASMAMDIKSLKNINKCETLLKRVKGEVQFQSVYTDFGHTFEPVARNLYAMQENTKHADLSVVETGFHINKKFAYVGASPDGIVSCKCHPTRLLEIKCSYKFQDILPSDIPKHDSSYHLSFVDGKLALNTTSPWYYQIQFQLGVTETQHCDFVIYTKKGIEVIPQVFDKDIWEDLLKKATFVFQRVVLPNV